MAEEYNTYSGAASGAGVGTMISPGMGTAIGAGVGLLGGLISNASSAKSAKAAAKANLRSAREQMAFQREMTQQQMNWQERMTGTAHQREVADLRGAGLNPILSGTGGMGAAPGGASTPGGASAAGVSYKAENIGDAVTNSAKAGGRLGAEIDLLQQQARKTEYDAASVAAGLPEQQRVAAIYSDPIMGPKAAAAKVAQQSNLGNKLLGATLEGGIVNSARDAVSQGFEKAGKWFGDRTEEAKGIITGKRLGETSEGKITHPGNLPKVRKPELYPTPWGTYSGNN